MTLLCYCDALCYNIMYYYGVSESNFVIYLMKFISICSAMIIPYDNFSDDNSEHSTFTVQYDKYDFVKFLFGNW